MTLEASFTYDKSTKGTHRYKEVGPRSEHIVGTLYVRKDAVGDAAPSAISLVIDIEEANAPEPTTETPKPVRRRRAS